jgi:predicted nucleotidyltransferase
MRGQHGLSPDTVAKIGDVLSRFAQIDKAVLCGSRAKGNPRPGSDIDLTLFGDQLDQQLLAKIDDTLDDLLLPYRFDLSIVAKITHPALLDHINRVGIVLYEKSVTSHATHRPVAN